MPILVVRRCGWWLLFLTCSAQAFVNVNHNNIHHTRRTIGSQSVISRSVSIAPQEDNFWVEKEEVASLIKLTSGNEKEKILNMHGLWCVLVSALTMPIWIMAMTLVETGNKLFPEWDPNRETFDKTGKVWAKSWLQLTNSYPTMSGDLWQEGPCVYVANHASWLDIALLCVAVEPVFKFIAKSELAKMPGIGQQLEGGQHIMIDRQDRRSQLRTFKQGVSWLKKGVPLMAFPEGTRSKTGRLQEFKGGMFSMAMKTGVPIVPITLSHTHAVFPPYAMLPVQAGHDKLHIHMHKPIESQGKTEEELAELVREAFVSTLPVCQHPLLLEQSTPQSAGTQ